jgi:TrmH family RNA methyltransferase
LASIIRSRDNPRVKHWSKLAQDTRYRKKARRALIEGPHLVTALVDARLKPVALIVSEGYLAEIPASIKEAGMQPIVLSEAVFRAVVDVETPQGIAAEIEIPAPGIASAASSKGSCVFLEGVQDAGNVGAIIRSAAAFGIASVILDNACADPWSPKVLRAGMGGHFSVSIESAPSLTHQLESFSGRLLCTVPRSGESLASADLSGRLGWVFGSEGKGVSAQALKEADLKITIPAAPGTESLNVAAAAAICLYEAFSRPSRRPEAKPQ